MNGDSGQDRRAASSRLQRAERVHLEIEERNGGRAIVRGLRGGVDDQVRTHFLQQREHTLAVPDVERGVSVAGDLAAQALQHPTGVALGPEENRAMVVVDPVDLKSLARKKPGDFRANQSAGAGHEYGGHSFPELLRRPRLPRPLILLIVHWRIARDRERLWARMRKGNPIA